MIKSVLVMAFLMITTAANAQVKIIAHRGSSHSAPENTVAAAKLAWKSKADGVETDVWLTKDGKIICSHDATTKRTSGKEYRVAETDSSVLRRLDVGSFKGARYKGEKMPFLHELIKGVPEGRELVVEIKCGPEILPALKKTVDKYGKNRRIVFLCFDLPMIAEMKEAFPTHECCWLCGKRELLDEAFDRAAAAGLQGVSLGHDIIDETVMKRAAELRLEVYSWTVDDPAEAVRLIGLGVRGITTNRPGWLREQVPSLAH